MGPVRAGSQGWISRLMLRMGLVLAALSFTCWWLSHTILDVSRTRRVTHVVLADRDFRDFVAEKLSPMVSSAVPPQSLDQALAAVEGSISPTTLAPGAQTPTPTPTTTVPVAAPIDTTTKLNNRLAVVLGQPEVESQLETFVVDVHKGLIGVSNQPAVLSQPTVTQIVTAAIPAIAPTELGGLHALTVNPPRIGALSTIRYLADDKFPLLISLAALCLISALTISKNRRQSMTSIGRWLIGISLIHLLFLWVVPVIIVPALSSSPWASLTSSVARALSGGLLTGLILLFIAGAGILLANRFMGDPTDVGEQTA